MLLVPGDPLNPRKVDPHFVAQAEAAREHGVVVARIDHDAIDRPDEAVAAVPAGDDDAVYRGWTMTTSQYDGFAKALDARRVTLRTNGEEYKTAHGPPHPALSGYLISAFTGPVLRTWWIGGRCQLVTPHPDTPDELPTGLDLIEIEPLVATLALPFVTVDLVRRTDGAWRIVELGDGQVSDWPAFQDPADLMAALF